MYSLALALSFVLIFTPLYLVAVSLRRRKNGLPRIGRSIGVFKQQLQAAKADFQANGRGMLMDAYQQMKNSNYLVQTQNMEVLVISPRFLPELRMLPLGDISGAHALVEKILGQYCGVDIMLQSRLHADVCRVNLTRNLGELFPGMHAAFAHTCSAFLKQFPPGVPVPAFGFMFTMILAVTSQVVVGDTIARDPAWQGIVSAYQQEVILVAKSIRGYPKWLRPVARHFIAPKHRIEKILKDADRLLTEPILARQAPDNTDVDVMKFLVQGSETVVPRTIILQMLVIMSASLYVSCMAATEALYDLVGKPEYVQPIRDELREAVSAEDGWTLSAIKRLPILDSFLKESSRYNAPEALGFMRVALSNIKLSDGTKIPQGSFLGMPAAAMSRDAQYYPDPDAFDGYRFCQQTSKEADNAPKASEYEFAGIEPGNLGWGSGRGTCPGRWFASAMNKLIIAGLFDKYDVSFPGDQKDRPVSIEDNGGLIPSMTQGLLLKERV